MAHRLLLADDSVTIQRVIELTFADEDVEVIAVGDGQQAIDRIGADAPDIVLADVDMPERDGYQVAEFIKRTPELAHIPVLLLTGAFEPLDQARVTATGCDGVLAKPFEPQLLIARVKELLASRRPARSAADRPSASDAASSGPAGASPLEKAQSDAPVEGRPATVSLDEYFERLDEAFSNLGPLASPGVPAAWPSAEAGPAPAQAEDAAPEANGSDWPAPAASQPSSAAPPHPVTPGSLASTFSVLLAAEQGEPLPPGVVGSAAASVIPLDAIVDEVARRVVRSSAGEAIREQVSALVAEIAERLVREEIERLKASIP